MAALLARQSDDLAEMKKDAEKRKKKTNEKGGGRVCKLDFIEAVNPVYRAIRTVMSENSNSPPSQSSIRL